MSWMRKKKVVVPVDFSRESLAAVEVALELVDGPSHVTVVHVLPLLTNYETDILWTSGDETARLESAQQALREKFSDPRFAGISVVVLIGDAGHEIVDLAESSGADLIVLPSHGRTGLGRLLIGSVAERVVRLAHCPVLVLKSPDKSRSQKPE